MIVVRTTRPGRLRVSVRPGGPLPVRLRAGRDVYIDMDAEEARALALALVDAIEDHHRALQHN